MTIKTKEYRTLDVKDVEEAVSEIAGRAVKIGEMDMTVLDLVPVIDLMEGIPAEFGLTCEVYVDGEWIFKEDEADEDNCIFPLSEQLPNEAYLDERYIFNFSTDLFKSYKRRTDSSD